MTVRLLTSRTLDSGQTQQFGDVVELPKSEAQRLIAAGQAMPSSEREAAMVQPMQNAMLPGARPRRV